MINTTTYKLFLTSDVLLKSTMSTLSEKKISRERKRENREINSKECLNRWKVGEIKWGDPPLYRSWKSQQNK